MIYSVLFIILFLLTYYWSYRVYNKSINPLFSVIGVFFAAMAIFYSADFIDHDLLGKTKAIYAVGLVCFVIGCGISYVSRNKTFKIKNTIPDRESLNREGSMEYYEHEKLLKIGFFITIVVTLLTVYVIIFEVGITAFLSDIFRSVRDTMRGTRIFTVNEYLKKTLLVFCPLEIDFMLRYKKRRVQCIVFLVLSLLLSISFTRVMFLYLLLLDSLTFYLFSTKRNAKLRNRILILAIIFAAVAFFNNTQEMFNKVMRTTGSVMGHALTSSQITILSYFFAPIKSSDMYVRMNLETVPLAATFRYVYEMFGVATTPYVDVPFVFIPFSFNTALAEYYLYREGGFLWLIFASLIFGFLSDRLFRDYLNKNTADKVVTACFILLCLLLSIRSYMLMFLEFWIPLITLIIVRKRLKKARFQDSLIVNKV